jgi:hypothetical protein
MALGTNGDRLKCSIYVLLYVPYLSFLPSNVPYMSFYTSHVCPFVSHDMALGVNGERCVCMCVCVCKRGCVRGSLICPSCPICVHYMSHMWASCEYALGTNGDRCHTHVRATHAQFNHASRGPGRSSTHTHTPVDTCTHTYSVRSI